MSYEQSQHEERNVNDRTTQNAQSKNTNGTTRTYIVHDERPQAKHFTKSWARQKDYASSFSSSSSAVAAMVVPGREIMTWLNANNERIKIENNNDRMHIIRAFDIHMHFMRCEMKTPLISTRKK